MKNCSSIDFFLTTNRTCLTVRETKKIDHLHQNVSDHYPISLTLSVPCVLRQTSKKNVSDVGLSRLVWDKVDKDMYKAIVEDNLDRVVLKLDSGLGTENTIHDVHLTLVKARVISGGKPRKRRSWPTLKVWNIKSALNASKQAYHQYKCQKELRSLSQETIEQRKQAKKNLRSTIRKEQARIDIQNRVRRRKPEE